MADEPQKEEAAKPEATPASPPGGTASPESAPAEATPTEEPKEPSPEPAEGEKKKGFHLFGKKGDKSEPKIVKRDPNEPLNPAELAQVIDKQILDAKSGDYWVIKIKKQVFLVIFGLILIGLWLIPLYKFVSAKFNLPAVSVNFPKVLELKDRLPFVSKDASQSPVPEATPATASAEPKVRIRYETGIATDATQIADKIKAAGITSIEMVEDNENSYSDLSLVVKPGQEELKAKLAAALKEYTLGTGSAELTEDSNFDILIMFGKP